MAIGIAASGKGISEAPTHGCYREDGQIGPRGVRHRAGEARREPAGHRGGRRRRPQLDAHRLFCQEVPRPLLQRWHRGIGPRRYRGRLGQLWQKRLGSELRGVHHVQRLRPATDVGGLPAYGREGGRHPCGHQHRRGWTVANGHRGRELGVFAAELYCRGAGRRNLHDEGGGRTREAQDAGISPGGPAQRPTGLRRQDPVHPGQGDEAARRQGHYADRQRHHGRGGAGRGGAACGQG